MDDQATDATSTDNAPETMDEALDGGALMNEIESSLADQAPESAQPGDPGAATVAPLALDELSERQGTGESVRDMDLLSDVDVEVSVEFGRVEIPVRQLLKLRRGSLVELQRRPEQQVTILANGKPIALGDVVVVDDQVGVHIVELIDPDAPPEPVPDPREVDRVVGSHSPADDGEAGNGDAEEPDQDQAGGKL